MFRNLMFCTRKRDMFSSSITDCNRPISSSFFKIQLQQPAAQRIHFCNASSVSRITRWSIIINMKLLVVTGVQSGHHYCFNCITRTPADLAEEDEHYCLLNRSIQEYQDQDLIWNFRNNFHVFLEVCLMTKFTEIVYQLTFTRYNENIFVSNLPKNNYFFCFFKVFLLNCVIRGK